MHKILLYFNIKTNILKCIPWELMQLKLFILKEWIFKNNKFLNYKDVNIDNKRWSKIFLWKISQIIPSVLLNLSAYI